MRRALVGLMLGLFLMGMVAALSRGAQVDREISHVRHDWVAVRSLPPSTHKMFAMQALASRTNQLARRYPENRDVKHWRKVVNSSYRRMMAHRQQLAG